MTRAIIPLALLLGCATAAGAQGRELLLSDAPPPEGRNCEILRRVPREYAAALDSAGLLRTLAADSAWRTLRGTALFSVRWDENGAVEWVRMLEGTLPTAAEGRVQGVIRAHVRPVQAREPFSLRVRVDLGAVPAVRVGRSEVCPAVMSQSGPVRMTESGSPQDAAELRRAGPYRVDVRVGTEGQVLDVKMRQSSRSRMRDDMVTRLARQSLYLPELVDGIKVAGWFELRGAGALRRQ